ncbi:MAG: class I SAM-dependent methyltransferase [Actinobacteria bacterium]|nr:class I SAM-dependent methyltransferase [Actinomycetota bacterium]
MWLMDKLRKQKYAGGAESSARGGNAGDTGADMFNYKGYLIPRELINLTGGGVDTWDDISLGHQEQLRQYCPIEPGSDVLEIGCGVGRDAIQLADFLDAAGSYTGIDIIRPSIEWCQDNISRRHPNFKFHYLDIQSQIHNSAGSLKTTEIRLPVEDGSIDRIILHSVFTHMFEDDIVHYLHEFGRVLRGGGKVMASFFILDEETMDLVRLQKQKDPETFLTFEHDYGNGCFINDQEHPEGAVGYNAEAFERMLERGRMRLVRPIGKGFWCGREGVTDGQDMAILEPFAAAPESGSNEAAPAAD